jgi:PAS domain S-box-containing protein
MQVRDVKKLVQNSGDPAFAIDTLGTVIAWNRPAEDLFGLSSEDALGQFCGDVVRGSDETGPVCSHECPVQRSVRRHETIANYDMEVQTPGGRRWCNVSVLLADVAQAMRPYSVHILRSVDITKRFSLLLQDVVVQATGLPMNLAQKGVAGGRCAAQASGLSKRQVEVLRLLARGLSNRQMAPILSISEKTVSHHIQHIYDKIDVSTRAAATLFAMRHDLIFDLDPDPHLSA